MPISMTLLSPDEQVFVTRVWDYYHRHGRSMPWRELSDDLRQRTYQVVVSEVMLQQTQVSRVINKYQDWMHELPTMDHVANADFSEVISLWSGLGYNRRAKYLWEALKTLAARSDKVLLDDLDSCKGIGSNTARAILTYVLDAPHPFVETNIRSVYLHHFFDAAHDAVTDAQILDMVTRTMDISRPREWFWALMDYGTMLKKEGVANTRSTMYRKQPKFSGSRRQVRGQVLKLLIGRRYTINALESTIRDERLVSVLTDLVSEKLIQFDGKHYEIYRESL